MISKNKKIGLSVVIPCYNEEKRIGKTLVEIIKFLKEKNFDFEIIVVDDGSRDKSIEIIRKYDVVLIKNKSNKGKGYSVKKGVEKAKKDLILFTDSDLATPISEIIDMIKEIEKGYDIVIASRNLKDSKRVVQQPGYRHIMGKIFPFLVNFLTDLNYKDTQCGFKLFKKNIAKDLFNSLTIKRWSFDVEILYIAKKRKYSVKEFAVSWFDKKGSKINPLKDSLMMLRDVLKIRYKDLVGNYN